jgi:Mrp family chromosome partitioning ATPase
MGRMADLLRQAERARLNPHDAPVAIAEVLAVREPEPVEDDDELDPTIPFIEVGDVHEPAIRLIRAADEPPPRPPVVAPPPPPQPPPPPDEPAFGGIIHIRFEPVRASHLSGRGFGADLIAYHQPDHAVSGQYRGLVAQIESQLPGSQPRALAFTAAAAQSGASTVLLNLAVTLAKRDANRVVVVDAHADRPALATRLGVSPQPGLRDVLARQTPLAWSLQETVQPNLLALTGGKPTTPWNGEELSGVLELLRGRADWVLVDAGPWEETSVAAAVADVCDAVYLVHRLTARDTASLQASILEATGRLRGCVITQA